MKEAVQWAIDHLVRLYQTPCPRNNEQWHEHINDLSAIKTRLEWLVLEEEGKDK